MKLGFALLCLVALALFTQQARAESIRWMQPDYEEGDTWEYRIIDVEPVSEGRHVEERLRVGEVHWADIAPLVSLKIQMRTWRKGAVSEWSKPVVYLPEPGLVGGLVAGCGALALSAFIASRPQASQKYRSFKS